MVAILSLISHADSEHRHHGAHVHGAGTIAIAFEKEKGTVEFQSAAESILGFEHLPKKSQDQKIFETTRQSFESEIGRWIQFDANLKCAFQKDKIEQTFENKAKSHSSWVARYSVTCAKSPLGSTLILDFSKFPKLKDLDVTILIDVVQKSAEYKGKVIKVELK